MPIPPVWLRLDKDIYQFSEHPHPSNLEILMYDREQRWEKLLSIHRFLLWTFSVHSQGASNECEEQ